MKKLNCISFTIFLGFFLLYNSCTIVGLGIDAARDSSEPDSVIVYRESYKTIKVNTEIIVNLEPNSWKAGKFIKISDTPVGKVDIQNTTDKFLIFSDSEWESELDSVNLDNIRNVWVKSKGNHKNAYFAYGLLIDVALMLIMSKN